MQQAANIYPTLVVSIINRSHNAMVNIALVAKVANIQVVAVNGFVQPTKYCVRTAKNALGTNAQRMLSFGVLVRKCCLSHRPRLV